MVNRIGNIAELGSRIGKMLVRTFVFVAMWSSVCVGAVYLRPQAHPDDGWRKNIKRQEMGL